MFALEIEFMDGKKVIVHDLTNSRAKVQAAYQRYLKGAETHRQLHIVNSVRRKDLDKHNHPLNSERGNPAAKRVNDFCQKLVENQKNMPPEFNQTVDKMLDDMIANPKTKTVKHATK